MAQGRWCRGSWDISFPPPTEQAAGGRTGTFTDDLHKLVDDWAREAAGTSLPRPSLNQLRRGPLRPDTDAWAKAAEVSLDARALGKGSGSWEIRGGGLGIWTFGFSGRQGRLGAQIPGFFCRGVSLGGESSGELGALNTWVVCQERGGGGG